MVALDSSEVAWCAWNMWPGPAGALQLIPAGSQRQIVSHPRLAYGERGAGRSIGPNATLIFEAELVGIKTGPEPPAKEKITGTYAYGSFRAPLRRLPGS
jgi:hypothetical protein